MLRLPVVEMRPLVAALLPALRSTVDDEPELLRGVTVLLPLLLRDPTLPLERESLVLLVPRFTWGVAVERLLLLELLRLT